MKRDYEAIIAKPTDERFWSVATSLLRHGRNVRFYAPGNSMSPFIRHGEAVTVSPCAPRDLRFGDIVLFSLGPNAPHSPKRLHRLVRRVLVEGQPVLFAKGDAYAALDPSIQPTQVLGKVSAIEKCKGTLNLNSSWGRGLNLLWSLLQVCPVSRCILNMGWRFFKPVRELLSSHYWGHHYWGHHYWGQTLDLSFSSHRPCRMIFHIRYHPKESSRPSLCKGFESKTQI